MMLPYLLLYPLFFPYILSECMNGCSGHGRCTIFDMCVCYNNWQANDCSERVCEFGLSFVDSPKGDLDSSDSIDGPTDLLLINSFTHPYGTSEQYPPMYDSDQNKIKNSAHWYAECSNVGICDRTTGLCDCFEGFEGAACQRMSCPIGEDNNVTCSGHGICQNLYQIAQRDYQSSYQLWDKQISRGCVCDKGFYGGDCSQRTCKRGIDPLYMDDVSRIQYPSFFFAVLTSAPTYDISDGFAQPGTGYFNILIYDQDGGKFYSPPLPARATCEQIISALESIPNSLIPIGYTKCFRSEFQRKDPLSDEKEFSIEYSSLYRMQLTDGIREYSLASEPAFQIVGYDSSYDRNSSDDKLLSGDIYLLQFYGNPGSIGQPEINTYLYDGSKPSLMSPNGTLITRSWTNGQQGFDIDYVPTHCAGIKVRIIKVSNDDYALDPIVTINEVLQKCLGSADFDDDNDVFFNNYISKNGTWDRGSIENPHLVRIVRSTADDRDGGFFILVYYDPDFYYISPGSNAVFDGGFRVMHPFKNLDNLTTDGSGTFYDLYTTKGVVQLVSNKSEAIFDFGSNMIYTVNITDDINNYENGHYYDKVDDISCEARGFPSNSPANTKDCLENGDLFFVLDAYHAKYNPPYINMYTTRSISGTPLQSLMIIADVYGNNITIRNNSRLSAFKQNIITSDLNMNWAQNPISGSGVFRIYKFFPHKQSSYEYMSECSNRGICNTFEGICDCFTGYSGESCSVQDSIAY
eukprot:gene11527-15440_t